MYDGAKKMRIIFISLILLIMIFDGSTGALAASKRSAVKNGNRYYNKGHYDLAVEKYAEALDKDAESDIVNYNMGTALYKKENFDQSIEHLQKSLLTEDKALKEKVYYNLGNAFYRKGLTLEDEKNDSAISAMEESLGQYKKVLELNENDDDAKNNYEVVLKKLKQLRNKREMPNNSERNQSSNAENKDQENPDGHDQSKDSQGSDKDSDDSMEDDDADRKMNQDNEEKNDQDNGGKQEDENKDDPENRRQDKENKDGGQHHPQDPQADQKHFNKEMTKQEARIILDNYQQGEEPKGMLNFYPKGQEAAPVLKDW
jgi:Ca-activated chloride channel family protein